MNNIKHQYDIKKIQQENVFNMRIEEEVESAISILREQHRNEIRSIEEEHQMKYYTLLQEVEKLKLFKVIHDEQQQPQPQPSISIIAEEKSRYTNSQVKNYSENDIKEIQKKYDRKILNYERDVLNAQKNYMLKKLAAEKMTLDIRNELEQYRVMARQREKVLLEELEKKNNIISELKHQLNIH